MNPWEMAKQIQDVLRTMSWPGGSTEKVFGPRGVYVFAGTPTEEQVPPAFPWALIGIDTATADEDHPEVLTQDYTIVTAAEVAGDPLGSNAVIGGSVAELGKSVGRGIAEIDERVRIAVGNLLGVDGAKIKLSTASIGSPTRLGRGHHIAMASLTITAVVTSALHYAAPQLLVYAAGTWTWSGPHCSDRFDFLQYRLVSLAGASPPETPADGTVVYTGSTASFTASRSGSTTYSVFADYNARAGSSVDGSSSGSEVGAYVVVS